jgi:transcriptional regulator with XRE-family HTH domain
VNNQGEIIKELIMQKGFKVKQFAEMLGMTEQAMHRIFKKETVHYSRLLQIADLLKVDVSVFSAKQSKVNEPIETYEAKKPQIEAVTKSLMYVIENQKEFITQQKEFIDGQRDFIKSLLYNNK